VKKAALIGLAAGALAGVILAVVLILVQNSQNASARRELRNHGFNVVDTDVWSERAVLRGPGGCKVRVHVVRDDGNLLVLQDGHTVDPNTVKCSG